MKDRGPHKIIKNVKPIAHEPAITKNVLRGFSKSAINNVNPRTEMIIGV